MSKSLLFSSSSRAVSATTTSSSLTSLRHASSKASPRRHIDPWAVAAARQKKAANISRQQELRAQREAALGHPLRGTMTPFLDTLQPGRIGSISAEANAKWEALPQAEKEAKMDEVRAFLENPEPGPEHAQLQKKEDVSTKVNYFLSQEEVEESLRRSRMLTLPLPAEDRTSADSEEEKRAMKQHAEQDEVAREAIRRIIQLQNGNNKDLTRVNVMRCIEQFGRHNTDATLGGRLPVYDEAGNEVPLSSTKERVGPDTGSSEVQVAILTAKIEVLSKQLQTTSHKDKHNKRNLRLLVHRRQKLLKYLRRKERGGRGGRT
ncbi:structural constituent of ribosome [Ascosphaera pollenicola]|nr:structural constituent of ribosome [Ascosphaera pollenicola]